MDIEKKRLLQEKLEKSRKERENNMLDMQRKSIMSNIEDFDVKYRFANKAEIERIESFIGKLHFSSPAHIKTNKAIHISHDKMFLCFLSGSVELLKIYIYGKYEDFMNDYSAWDFFSPYLLMIDEDFSHYIFINDNGEIKESKIGEI